MNKSQEVLHALFSSLLDLHLRPPFGMSVRGSDSIVINRDGVDRDDKNVLKMIIIDWPPEDDCISVSLFLADGRKLMSLYRSAYPTIVEDIVATVRLFMMVGSPA
jgi:hypothetical protein